MTETRLYTTQALVAGETLLLECAPSKHLLRVLRCRLGDRCVVFNGDGLEYVAEIIDVDRQATLRLLTATRAQVESPLQITLAQSISRGEKMDYAIQKSVECGVHAIVPLLTDRCGVKLSAERALKRQAHWQAVAISACEQSGRCVVPVVDRPILFSQWLSHATGVLFAADTMNAHTQCYEGGALSSCAVLIGPEGGFSDKERQCIKQKPCYGLSLGPRVLRTETAPVVALTQLQIRWGDVRW